MINLFLFFLLIFSSFMDTANCEENLTPNNSYSHNQGPTTPKEYVVPRVSQTHPLERIRESKSCREYLTICERSCKDRGDMFKFACIGQNFQPFEDHSRCTCGDDLYVRKDIAQGLSIRQDSKQ